MYVGYVQLDKEPAMYPHQGAVSRHPGLSLSPQSFAPPQYPDFAGYHHHHHHHSHHLAPDPHAAPQAGPAGGWTSAYPAPPPARDDWSSHHYAAAAAAAAAAAGGPPGPSAVPGPAGPALGFSPPEFSGQPPALLTATLNTSSGQLSPGSPRRRNPYDWIRASAPPSNPNGKTRTKDKYRVVYTDHQRLELEKEFHYSKYITIRRKAELATALSLSERQVKIWFQNRRAKERKINKKKLQQPASSTTAPTPPTGSAGGGAGGGGGGLHGNAMVTSSSGLVALTIKEEY